MIAEIETDKATMEWESPEDGVLTEIYVEEGGKVEVGQRIAFIGAEGEAAPAESEKKEGPAKTEVKEKTPAKTEKPEKAAPKKKAAKKAPAKKKVATKKKAAGKKKH